MRQRKNLPRCHFTKIQRTKPQRVQPRRRLRFVPSATAHYYHRRFDAA